METELKDSSANTAADFATAADKDKLPLLKPNSNPSDAPTVTSESIEELEKKYAAYVRNDAYGTMGRRELLLNEKVMLGFALITLVPIRLVIGILILLVYYLICLFCTLFKDPNRGDEQGDYAHLSGWRRDVVLQCGRWLSRAMLFNFGFYWLNETRRDSLDEMDKIFTKIAKATHSTGTCPSSSTTDSSSTPDETSRPEETYQVLVQRCMEICDEPCISIPGLSDEEVWALPLPEKMLHDKKRRDKKNMSKQIVYDSKLNEFVAWLIEIDAQIDAAKRRGDNLHHFLSEGGRGPNDETTKRLKDGRRVQLDWQIGVPTGPGRWPTYFIRYIGILVRNCEHWNIGFTWEENPYEAVVWTWKSLQKYYDLDDASNEKYEFIKAKMGDLFKKYRSRFKKNFNRSIFQHDWQRFYGLPSTVRREQFCYLLRYWESDEAKEKSRIGSENRAKVESDYYGGSQGALQYRYITEKAKGGSIPLYVVNTALHISDQSSEAEREIIERHNLRLIEGETRYRERNPEYPCGENIPLAEEEAIIDQEFPRAASKGRRPLLGRVRSHRSISSSTVESQQPNSTRSEVFTQIQEELQREHETNAALRRQVDEMYSEWREFQQWKHQQQSQSLQQQSQTSSHQQSTPQQQWTPQQYSPTSQYLPPSQNPPPSQYPLEARYLHLYPQYPQPSQYRPTPEGDAFLFDWQRRHQNLDLSNNDDNIRNGSS